MKDYGLDKGHPMVFSSLAEAKNFALANPGSVIVRNPDGDGFIIKGSGKSDKNSYRHVQDARKREDNERLGQPKNAGISWYDRDIAILIKLHQQQIAVNDIAKQLERTSVAISSKLRSLELISELEHQNNMELYLSGS